LWAVLLVAILPPVATGTAARAGGVPPRRALAALALTVPGVLPLAWLSPLSLLVAAAIGVAVLGWLARFLRRRIGGSTGDCLGFAAYAGQLTLLLAVAAG
ncbi:adenosylcobinamide-GDP ribazoletransferase, partial [Sphingomonas sp. 2SG]